MKDRIKEIRNYLGLSQTDFAKKILVSRSAICKIESGENTPSDQTINLICREFDINEKWLRTGSGDMHIHLTRKQKIVDFIGESINEKESIKTTVLEGLSELDEEDWEDIDRIIKKFLRLNEEKE